MTDIVVTSSLFPDGTIIGAYDATGYPNFPRGGPPGTATDTSEQKKGSVKLEGLTDNKAYFAAAKVGGDWKNVRFIVNAEDPAAWHTIGPPGVDGTGIRHGAGAPSDAEGISSDFYIDLAASPLRLYGPKLGGTWGSEYIEIATVAEGEGFATDVELAAHAADTTSIHGIADTSKLLTDTAAAGGDLTGTLSNLQIAAGSVGTTEIAAEGVETSDIKNGAVTAAKVAADVATQAELDTAAFKDSKNTFTKTQRIIPASESGTPGLEIGNPNTSENGVWIALKPKAGEGVSVAQFQSTDAEAVNLTLKAFLGKLEFSTLKGDIVLDPSTEVVDMGTSILRKVKDPSEAQDAATKKYVDGYLEAGAGLTKSGSKVDAGAGAGISVEADKIAIDETLVPRKDKPNVFIENQTIKGETPAVLLMNAAAKTIGIFEVEGTVPTLRGNSNSTGLKLLAEVGPIKLLPSTVVQVNNKRIIEVAEPTEKQDVATKNYVDTAAAGGDLTGTLSNLQIAAGSVGTTEIAAEGVETSDIKNLAVTGGKLASEAVENAKIKEGAVSSAKLAAGAVTETKLGPAAVTDAKLANPITRGQVSAAGALVLGTGFEVEKTGTGKYTIKLKTELGTTGICILTIQGGVGAVIKLASSGKKEFKVETFSGAIVAEDNIFDFMIMAS